MALFWPFLAKKWGFLAPKNSMTFFWWPKKLHNVLQNRKNTFF